MNIKNFLKDIKFYKKIYFISPHLDDAILSSGALIYELKDTGKVSIITVFTKIPKKNNSLTLEFIKSSGYTDSKKLFLDRQLEDKSLCRYLKIKYYHLDFLDALWRNNFNSLKEVFDNTVNNGKNEKKLEKEIIKKLKNIIKDNKKNLIFAPLALGNHIDHIIVNKICNDNFTNVIYWEDYPYNLKYRLSKNIIKKNNFFVFEFKKNLFIKEKLIKFYQSQINMLFGDKPIIIKKERYYYTSKKFINNTF